MKKLVKVHMLPTEDNSGLLLGLSKQGKLISYNVNDVIIENDEYNQKQHLYFTSDEEIKENDWMYDIDGDIGQAIGNDITEWEGNRKIVATTDKTLKITKSATGYAEDRTRTFYSTELLPQIPQQFIEDYCKARGIDEIYLEYFDDKIGHAMYSTPNWQLKLDSNNCVIISPIKESWNREEVNILMEKAYVKGYSDKDDGNDHTNEKLADWIIKTLQ